MVDALEKSILANVDEKGFVPDDVRNAFFRKLRMKSDNRSCFECPARNPTWNSLTYGVYLCLECSGEHRRKGVHISFVRSVELDRFTPEQMVQMAVGGNGKAWEFFKQSGMGKTSGEGRPIDYNSKPAQKYKQMMEKDTETTCGKFGVRYKEPAKAPPAAIKGDPVDEAADFAPPSLSAGKASATAPPAPSSLARGASAPAASAGYPAAKAPTPAPAMSNIKVLRATSDSTVVGGKPTSPTAASSVPKPSGFAGKQHKAKEIDFDFDFDELESEMSKPAPAPAPKAAPAPTPAPATAASTSKPMFANNNEAPAARSPATNGNSGSDVSKFNNKKGISSDDFFHEELNESAQARMDRENRYSKLAGQGAISSSSFFGDGDSPDARRSNSGDMEDWKAMASNGATMARAGLSKGADLLATYLNKVRD